MTTIRGNKSARVQDRRTPAQKAQERNKIANPGVYPKKPKPRTYQPMIKNPTARNRKVS